MWMLLVLLLSSPALACDRGCYLYEGTCTCDLPVAESAPSVTPSMEKPPKDKMPSYQRDGITVLMPASLVAQDEKDDADIKEAEKQGRSWKK